MQLPVEAYLFFGDWQQVCVLLCFHVEGEMSFNLKLKSMNTFSCYVVRGSSCALCTQRVCVSV